MKIQKEIVTPKWLKIKEMYEKGTNGSDKYGTNFEINGELDQLCLEFTDILAELTIAFGDNSVIEGVRMNVWKERIFSVIENAGLLPEIAWKDELAEEERKIQELEKDTWYQEENEEEVDWEDLDANFPKFQEEI